MSANKYRTILLDPPWPEYGGGKSKRGADKHYSLLSVHDIPRVILSAKEFNPMDNAHCYLWTTNNYLRKALWVMDMIGFEYKTKITWAKDKIGLGQYFRGKTEDLLFGIRGKGTSGSVITDRKDLSTLLHADRVDHSKKPTPFYELIEARSKGPYLEMFHRCPKPGERGCPCKHRKDWNYWGNEVIINK